MSLTRWDIGSCAEGDMPGIMQAPGGCNCGGAPCSQTFTVRGCLGALVSGATVTVYDTMGGSTLATGATNSSGVVSLSWTGSTTVYVTASAPTGGLFTYGQTLTLTCGGGTTLPLFPTTLYCTISGCGSLITLPSGDSYYGSKLAAVSAVGAGITSLCGPDRTDPCYCWDGVTVPKSCLRLRIRRCPLCSPPRIDHSSRMPGLRPPLWLMTPSRPKW